MFSVRGDGVTTVSMDAAAESALVAHATAAVGTYTGSVLVSKSVDTSSNGASFYLMKALTASGSSPLEMFSVRGDGLTTVSMDAAAESALVAHATAGVGTYEGSVLVAKSVDESVNGASFYLMQALTGSGSLSALEMFSVRGDGRTKSTTDRQSVSAVIADASHASYSGVVLEARTSASGAGAGFSLFKVWLRAGRVGCVSGARGVWRLTRCCVCVHAWACE